MIPRVAMLVLCASLSGCRAERSYQDEIQAWRAEKDSFMQGSAESPVPSELRKAFPPLAYYSIDEQFRVPAALEVVRHNDTMEMSTSTGTRRTMRRIGRLQFTLQSRPVTLTAFAEASDTTLRRLFVPFGDPTNTTGETYRGGRYLDLDRTVTGLYDLDFNRAYHPFCVFNPTYECPVPPRENHLAVPVRAGERLPQPDPAP